MQLHTLQPATKRKKGKRIGRGGKRGTYSGRGIKGQRARSGHKIRPASRDLLIRIPKLRGSRNKSLRDKTAVVHVGDLEKKIKGGTVNRAALEEARLIRKSVARVKILGDGEITRALKVEGLEVSESARKKIEAAGGEVRASS